MQSNWRRERANLAVIITCGAVGLAVAVPAIGQARGNAQRTACASNLHQLGIALNTYAAEFDSLMPLTRTNSAMRYNVRMAGDKAPKGESLTDNDPPAALWLVVADGIVRRTTVFLCPADPFAGPNGGGQAAALKDDSGKAYETFQSGKQLSYSSRYPWTETDKAVKAGPWMRLVTIPRHEPVMTDMAPYLSAKAQAGEAVTGPAAASAPAGGNGGLVLGGGLDAGPMVNSPNHNQEGQNLLFGDGHVEWSDAPHWQGTGDHVWTEVVDGKQVAIDAGELPAVIPGGAKGPYDIVMVPTRSAKGELK
jgi:prepilin-type processing-associated H-X9-DG protein